jgi:hypothetical protein
MRMSVADGVVSKNAGNADHEEFIIVGLATVMKSTGWNCD